MAPQRSGRYGIDVSDNVCRPMIRTGEMGDLLLIEVEHYLSCVKWTPRATGGMSS
jgi:hypothetical protein